MADTATTTVQRLFLAESARLRGFAIGLTGDAALAEDVVQETFLTCTAKAAEFRPGSDFTAWARTILRFKVLEHLRRRDRGGLPLTEATLARLADEAPPPARWDAHRAALAGCIDLLAPRAREVTELRHLSDLTPSAIAARLGWTIGAVNVALSRARSALRDCIHRKLREAGDG